jgi:imidazolonepropionase-like amidohydrolase
VKAGLNPMTALQTATANVARVLRQNDLGTVEPGKLAAFVLLNANPFADIRNTQQIYAVIKGEAKYQSR